MNGLLSALVMAESNKMSFVSFVCKYMTQAGVG